MKFEVAHSSGFWEVGFFSPQHKWICLTSYKTKLEADEECKRLIGGTKFSVGIGSKQTSNAENNEFSDIHNEAMSMVGSENEY